MLGRGWLFAVTGRASDAVQMIASGITAWRSTGATLFMPWLSYLAGAHAELGQLDDARRCIDEAMSAVETTKERWFEAEVNRVAGEIALKSPERDTAKAEAYFKRALAVARQQQAKSWELRAAMSMARLWRDQGKRDEAREPSRSSLRLVYRRVRHARSERGEGVARRVGQVKLPVGLLRATPSGLRQRFDDRSD